MAGGQKPREGAQTQDELITQLNDANAKAQKIGAETQSLIDKIKELLEIIATMPVKPELTAAADAVTAQLEIVDGLVADPEGKT